MSQLRLLIADDHELVRRGLRATVEDLPQWEVVAEATNGLEAVALARRLEPDVVVLDLSMPELNGLEATRQIRQLVPNARVLILTVHESEQVVREVLDAGAQGYLLKSDAGRELLAALEALALHKPFFTSKVAQMVLHGYLHRDAAPAPEAGERLSGREREIVQLLAEGRSNKEVAGVLHISVRTVETHRNNIMRKMQFRSITDLVRYAIRNHMVSA